MAVGRGRNEVVLIVVQKRRERVNNLAFANYPANITAESQGESAATIETNVFASSLIIPTLFACVPRAVVSVIIKKCGRVHTVGQKNVVYKRYERELQLTFMATGT
jgi:hypothetical protein